MGRGYLRKQSWSRNVNVIITACTEVCDRTEAWYNVTDSMLVWCKLDFYCQLQCCCLKIIIKFFTLCHQAATSQRAVIQQLFVEELWWAIHNTWASVDCWIQGWKWDSSKPYQHFFSEKHRTSMSQSWYHCRHDHLKTSAIALSQECEFQLKICTRNRLSAGLHRDLLEGLTVLPQTH